MFQPEMKAAIKKLMRERDAALAVKLVEGMPGKREHPFYGGIGYTNKADWQATAFNEAVEQCIAVVREIMGNG